MPRRTAVQRNQLLKNDKIKLKEVLRSTRRSTPSQTPELADKAPGVDSLSNENTPGSSSSHQNTPAIPEAQPSDQPVDDLPDTNTDSTRLYKVNIDEKIIVLGLVRHWEILQIVSNKKTATSAPRHGYGYLGYNGFSNQSAQAMLESAAPMDLGDATKLWQTIMRDSALDWHRRGGLKKDYKRWTFKWWAMYKRGPPQLTVDARGSESDFTQRINSVEKRMQGIEVSANHQYYIRSHGRVAECYFIYNPAFSTDALINECYRSPSQEDDSLLARKKRVRHVYGPRVIDMSTENGKHLLNWIFGDISQGGAFNQKLPRYWSIFCGSLAEQPAFEVHLKERPLTKSQVQHIAAAKVWAKEKSIEPADSVDVVEGNHTSVANNEVDMDAHDEGNDHTANAQDESDEAAVELAASSPLTEEENDAGDAPMISSDDDEEI